MGAQITTSTALPYNTLGRIVGDIPHNAALVETVVTLQLSFDIITVLMTRHGFNAEEEIGQFTCHYQ